MGAFEYLLLFAVVILGLAASDLVVSLHRLLDDRRPVKWDWLAPLAALVAFEKLVTQWWYWHSAQQFARGLTFEMYLGLLAGCVLLFLLAAAALPDEAGEAPVDLAAHFAAIRRRWWLLFVLHWLATNAVTIWIQMRIAGARFSAASFLAPASLVPLAALALIFIRNRWINGAALAVLAVVYATQFMGQPLS